MAFETILYDVADGIATITLNRADKLNAFTEDLHRDLAAGLARADADETVRCVLLTGAGRAFSAGQDLSERAMMIRAGGEGPDIGDTVDRLYNRLVRAIRGARVPVVCAVNGVAAGAGANVALACDIVIAGHSAQFIQAFCKVGLVPDAGGTYHLPRLIGRARATALAMLGDAVSAEQAEAWGLIWRCVDDAALLDEARAVARRLAEGPTFALGMIKRAMDASGANTLDAQLDLERDFQQQAGKSDDYREGVTAFMDKRPPRFRGR